MSNRVKFLKTRRTGFLGGGGKRKEKMNFKTLAEAERDYVNMGLPRLVWERKIFAV